MCIFYIDIEIQFTNKYTYAYCNMEPQRTVHHFHQPLYELVKKKRWIFNLIEWNVSRSTFRPKTETKHKNVILTFVPYDCIKVPLFPQQDTSKLFELFYEMKNRTFIPAVGKAKRSVDWHWTVHTTANKKGVNESGRLWGVGVAFLWYAMSLT